jgi:hypothetical protein
MHTQEQRQKAVELFVLSRFLAVITDCVRLHLLCVCHAHLLESEA